jgi:signal transduction histidine kinase
LLHTLFYNIITNAVKYNVENGKIMISGAKQDGFYAVQIRDTGIGIASPEIPFIFDRFRRFRPAEDMSYGLGLPIVRTIAEFHNITLQTTSELHKGSTFILLFPTINRS